MTSIAENGISIKSKDNNLWLPYVGTKFEKIKNGKFKSLIFVFHGKVAKADEYFNNCKRLIESISIDFNDVSICAPQLLSTDEICEQSNTSIIDGLLAWKIGRFQGGVAVNANNNKKTDIGTIDIIKNIIQSYLDNDSYSTIKNVILIGHSGGGQLVQRLAYFLNENRISDKSKSITFSYISLNPGVFLYTEPASKDVDKNVLNYPYGSENVWECLAWHKEESTTSNYYKKNVYFLAGEKDTKTEGIPEAPGQGSNRLERFVRFRNHTNEMHPHNKFHFNIVPTAGHSGGGMICSPEVKAIVNSILV